MLKSEFEQALHGSAIDNSNIECATEQGILDFENFTSR